MSLFQACQRVDVEQVKVLLEQNNDFHQIDEQGRSALHHCSENSTIDCAKLLLADDQRKHFMLNLQDQDGCSALHLACLNGNYPMVKYLCEQGADVTLLDKESHSIVHWITVSGHADLLDIVLKYPTSIHTADIYGAYPIHYAAQLCTGEQMRKGLEMLKKLIECNAEVNCLDEQKRTPFMWAASAGAIDALRLLYKAGADPMHVDKDSLSALHCAATCGHASSIRLLVELYGCSLESEDIHGCTPLFYAVTLCHSDACQMLLDLKANPNHQDHRERTPSHCAALKGNLDCLKRLLASHADIWVKNKHGDYPVHEAIQALSFSKLHQNEERSQLQTGCCDIIRHIFQLYPKNINIRNDEEQTPLHQAARLGHIDMCEVLIASGAQVNALIHTVAGNYITPYDLARIHHKDACADYLALNHGGQRGNLLTRIQARRIQRFFRENIAKDNRKVESLPVLKPIIVRMTTNDLLIQAKACLDNKILDDRRRRHRRRKDTTTTESNIYLTNKNQEKGEHSAEQRRHTFVKSRTMMTTMHREEDDQHPERIIIHRSNSVATSVKLYERHKLIAEELFKFKQARLRNHFIVINRSLYKILIENAFNPHNRQADEIEKYLETLLKAYEVELEAIRRRTKSASPRRAQSRSQRQTQQQK